MPTEADLTEPVAEPVTAARVHDLISHLTSPGQMFEVSERVVGGQTVGAFTHAAANVVDLLAGGRAHGSQTFLVYDDQRLSYDDFFARVDAVAAAFQNELGIEAGDRVAIAMRNCPDWMVAFTAAVNVGAIAVPFNSWGSVDELEFSLSNCGAKVLVADPKRASVLAPALQRVSTKVLLANPSDPATGSAAVEALELLDDVAARHAGETYVVATPASDDVALMLYTSGSTGHPKGVPHRHVSVCQAVMHMFFAGYLPMELTGPVALRGGATTEAQILTVPLFHATGLCSGFIIPCVVGNKVAILRKWDATRALEVIHAERITMLATVPAVIKDLLTHPDFDNYDTSSLSRVAAAGAATPVDLPGLIEEKFGTMVRAAGFGMTESMAVAATMNGPLFDLHPFSAGVLSPVIEIRFVGPDGAVLPDGEEGEIHLKGVTLTTGYWDLDELTATAFTDDGWYRTGDVGQMTADGFLYITGRIKEMVIRGGENIYPAEIENAAYRHPAVKEAAAFGVEDERLGEEMGLVCFLQPGRPLTESELRDHIAMLLPTHKVPRYIAFADEPLPRNASEKIHRLEVRNTFVNRNGQ